MADQAGKRKFTVDTPRFLTVLLDDTVRCGKLRIPKKFAAEHGALLPNTIFLKLPSGLEWEVGVLRSCGSKMWFHEGWREFAKLYSLAPGHLLVFEYGSRGRFLVLIFDMTATEIDYQAKEANRVVLREGEVVDVSDDDLDGDLDDHVTSPKTRKKPPLRSPQPCKLRRRNEKGISVSNSETVVRRGSCPRMAKQGKKTVTGNHTSGVRLKGKLKKLSKSENNRDHVLSTKPSGASETANHQAQTRNSTFQRKEQLTTTEKARLLARANVCFKSENPFFMLAMQPSYVGRKIRTNLPVDFFKRNFKEGCGDILLRVQDGRVWTVDYRVVDYGEREKAIFGPTSWTPFARENSLKVGDVCAFELVKGGRESILNVVIFHATQYVNRRSSPHLVRNRTNGVKPKKSSTSPGSNKGKVKKLPTGASKAANAFTSKRPLFKVSVVASDLPEGQMLLTQPFSDHIKDVYDMAELRVAGKCWGVRIRKVLRKTGRFRRCLGAGWRAFAAQNSLKVGDVCVYEVMRSKVGDAGRRTMVLNVHIFRS